MRRFTQELTQSQNIEILKNGKTGVLAVLGDENYPYAIPLNYVYYDSIIYFHCAKEGHKIDSIKNNPKCSFCVVDKDEVIAEKFATDYRSVVVFGKISIIDNEEEKIRTIKILTKKYAPNCNDEIINQTINAEKKFLCMLKLIPQHITGKQAKKLK